MGSAARTIARRAIHTSTQEKYFFVVFSNRCLLVTSRPAACQPQSAGSRAYFERMQTQDFQTCGLPPTASDILSRGESG